MWQIWIAISDVNFLPIITICLDSQKVQIKFFVREIQFNVITIIFFSSFLCKILYADTLSQIYIRKHFNKIFVDIKFLVYDLIDVVFFCPDSSGSVFYLENYCCFFCVFRLFLQIYLPIRFMRKIPRITMKFWVI